MNYKVREATLNDLDKGLLKVFIEGYRYHQNGRPDIFAELTGKKISGKRFGLVKKHVQELRKYFPELWERLRYMDKNTWRRFSKIYSVEQLEVRFAYEDELLEKGLPIKGKPFFNALNQKLKCIT